MHAMRQPGCGASKASRCRRSSSRLRWSSAILRWKVGSSFVGAGLLLGRTLKQGEGSRPWRRGATSSASSLSEACLLGAASRTSCGTGVRL